MDLLTEIREDMRADRASRLWERYGRWIIYTAISIVLVTAGVVYYRHHETTEAMARTEVYMEVNRLFAQGDDERALVTLDTIKLDEGSEFSGMVLLRKIEVLRALERDKEAEAVLQHLAAQSSIYGDVGRILQRDARSLASVTSPVLEGSLQEREGFALLAEGKKAEATTTFQALANNERMPDSMRARARMVSHYLGGGNE